MSSLAPFSHRLLIAILLACGGGESQPEPGGRATPAPQKTQRSKNKAKR